MICETSPLSGVEFVCVRILKMSWSCSPANRASKVLSWNSRLGETKTSEVIPVRIGPGSGWVLSSSIPQHLKHQVFGRFAMVHVCWSRWMIWLCDFWFYHFSATAVWDVNPSGWSAKANDQVIFLVRRIYLRWAVVNMTPWHWLFGNQFWSLWKKIPQDDGQKIESLMFSRGYWYDTCVF